MFFYKTVTLGALESLELSQQSLFSTAATLGASDFLGFFTTVPVLFSTAVTLGAPESPGWPRGCWTAGAGCGVPVADVEGARRSC